MNLKRPDGKDESIIETDSSLNKKDTDIIQIVCEICFEIKKMENKVYKQRTTDLYDLACNECLIKLQTVNTKKCSSLGCNRNIEF